MESVFEILRSREPSLNYIPKEKREQRALIESAMERYNGKITVIPSCADMMISTWNSIWGTGKNPIGARATRNKHKKRAMF